jgi:hypothetical protein
MSDTMVEVIVILNADDVPHAARIAADLKGCKVVTFDPVLVDRLAAHHVNNVQLIAWDACPSYPALSAAAHEAATAIESELDLAVRAFIPDVSIFSWQHLNLYYLLMSLKWYGAMFDELGKNIVADKFHILVCNHPALYYFNCFIPSLLLMQYLNKNGLEFVAYNYGERADDTNLVPDLRGVAEPSAQETLLAHLPTCMYDIGYFNQEIQASGKAVTNIRAKYFDMPVLASKNIALTAALDAAEDMPTETRQKISSFSITLSTRLETLLIPYIAATEYRHRQTRNLAALYTSQLVTYTLLNTHFQHAMPSKVLLSDHDAGFHGPLVAFAQKHHLPVLMLPHSKTSADIEFTYRNITALVHPVQGSAIFDANGKTVPHHTLCYPENFSGTTSFTAPVKTVSLLLNGLSLGGIYYTRCNPYFNGIKKIVAWCKANDITLKIRGKPAYMITQILAKKTGASLEMLNDSAAETMEQHIAGCDLCLMYDTPTSGAMHFLKQSIPMLNVVAEAFSPAEMTMMNPNLVPQESVDEILHRLKGFKSDPGSFFAFRNAQFRQYVQSFQNAQPLRVFL